MTEQLSPATSERLDALMQAVVATASNLQLRDTLQRVLEAATTLVDARYGALGVFDDGQELIEFIPYGMSAEEASGISHWPEGRGLIGLIGREQRTVRLDHMGSHPAAAGLPDGHPKMDGFLGVPIAVGEDTFGNLYLTEKRTGPFTEEDERVVKMFAAAAATAIRNAALKASGKPAGGAVECSAPQD